MKPKLLVFDVDGTIVDSFEHGFQNAFNLIKNQIGDEITRDDYRELIKGNPWENILSRAGLSTEDKMSDTIIPGFIEPYADNQLFDDIKSTLERLAKKYQLTINTSTFISHVHTVFEREEIDTMFSVFMGPEVSIYKHVKLQMLMEEFGLEADELVFITDTVGDIAEAQKINVPTIGVTWGFSTREQLEEIAPTYLVHTAKELEELLLTD